MRNLAPFLVLLLLVAWIAWGMATDSRKRSPIDPVTLLKAEIAAWEDRALEWPDLVASGMVEELIDRHDLPEIDDLEHYPQIRLRQLRAELEKLEGQPSK